MKLIDSMTHNQNLGGVLQDSEGWEEKGGEAVLAAVLAAVLDDFSVNLVNGFHTWRRMAEEEEEEVEERSHIKCGEETKSKTKITISSWQVSI